MQAPRKAKADNGYFEVWVRPCGHAYRVTTEYYSGSSKAQMVKAARATAAAATCKQCEVQA